MTSLSVPNVSLNRSMTATGSAAPPLTAIRSCGRSSDSAAACSIPTYIVGTPQKTVTPSACISCTRL